MLTTSLEDLRRAERVLIFFRAVAAGFAILQVVVYDRLPWPPGLRQVGFVLAAALVAGDVVAWVCHRRVRTLRSARRLGMASLGFDVVMASAFVWLFTFDEQSAVWAVLYVLPLEGALRLQLKGAMAAWAVTAVLFSAREIYGEEEYGYELLWRTVSFKMGVGFLMAVVVGLMAEDLVRQRRRLAEALDQLQRAENFRSDLIWSLASEVQSPVAVILAEAAAKGVGGVRSRVRLVRSGGREVCYVWPTGVSEDEAFDRTVTVVHQGETVGDISVAKEEGEALTEADEQLLNDLASQAALALRNARLADELQERLEELRASRQRIVTAQDRERRRIERDIHDGAQQQLVAMAINLGLAKTLVGTDPEGASRVLEQLQGDTREVLETLRDLARGLFPPVLVESGLVPALQAHVAKMGLEAQVVTDSVATTRFDPQVEAAVYFCCREALQNASKHAPGTPVTVRVVADDGWLVFSVSDSGPGFDPATVAEGSGLRNLADRLEALGGHLEIRSAPGHGTTIGGRVPARRPHGGNGGAAGPLVAGGVQQSGA